VQLRDRELPVRDRLRMGEALGALVDEAGQSLLVNDRLDLALLLGARGVHLAEHSVTPADARQLLGPASFLSRAYHRDTPLGDELAQLDALLLSPIFAARKGHPALGIEALERTHTALRARQRRPALYALGGVEPQAAARARAVGAGGAAIGAVFEVNDLRPLVEALGIKR
jgi:thiamine-phosphate pyrophosphorylase